MYRDICESRGALADNDRTLIVHWGSENRPGAGRWWRSGRQSGWSVSTTWRDIRAVQSNTGFLVVEPRRAVFDHRFTVPRDAPTTTTASQRKPPPTPKFQPKVIGIRIRIFGLIRIRMSVGSVPKCCRCIMLSASFISPSMAQIGR